MDRFEHVPDKSRIGDTHVHSGVLLSSISLCMLDVCFLVLFLRFLIDGIFVMMVALIGSWVLTIPVDFR